MGKKLVHILVGGSLIAAIVVLLSLGYHHFVMGLNPFLGRVFVVLILLLAIPMVLWSVRILRGRWTPWMAFASGGLSWILVAVYLQIYMGNTTLDIEVHDTYYVIAHFDVVKWMVAIFWVIMGIYYWLEASGSGIYNRMGFVHFFITLIGCYFLFWPGYVESLSFMPRRYVSYGRWRDFDSFRSVNALMVLTAIVLLIMQAVFAGWVIYHLVRRNHLKRI